MTADWRSAQRYWDAAAETYEQDFSGTLIGRTRRAAVWRQADRLFQPGQRILELSCGTGEDAVHLAERGVRILACDLSPRMIELARARVEAARCGDRVDLRALANEEIGKLAEQGPFDGAFSNFAGLNCVKDLRAVAADLGRIVKPGGRLLTSMIGRFVPWEVTWRLAHLDFPRAFERRRRGAKRVVDGATVRVRYYSIGEIRRAFSPEFRLLRRRGIGVFVPPSYLEGWARRLPRTTRALAAIDERMGGWPLVRDMADAVLLEFERR